MRSVVLVHSEFAYGVAVAYKVPLHKLTEIRGAWALEFEISRIHWCNHRRVCGLIF